MIADDRTIAAIEEWTAMLLDGNLTAANEAQYLVGFFTTRRHAAVHLWRHGLTDDARATFAAEWVGDLAKGETILDRYLDTVTDRDGTCWTRTYNGGAVALFDEATWAAYR